ncbi:hypothetical protein [Fluviispira sanaruensis]|uniref:Uncharacterized protein n=1 Tax=Fluviispira sanaruensis TaxID=2493639 RepID=A0A4P2VPP2_FLUSA|nr:hypothetical protein [Fluviispira sanaruensis]BBH53799.1 hypothetical protein JCM31447_22490 [Fluviispira sanaruensis]
MSSKSFFRTFFKSLIFFISFTFTRQIFAAAPPDRDRIRENPIIDNQAGRCHKVAMPTDQCNKQRDHALSAGCINQIEYNTLIQINAYPLCNYDNELNGHYSCGCFEESTRIFSYEKSPHSGFAKLCCISSRPLGKT